MVKFDELKKIILNVKKDIKKKTMFDTVVDLNDIKKITNALGQIPEVDSYGESTLSNIQLMLEEITSWIRQEGYADRELPKGQYRMDDRDIDALLSDLDDMIESLEDYDENADNVKARTYHSNKSLALFARAIVKQAMRKRRLMS